MLAERLLAPVARCRRRHARARLHALPVARPHDRRRHGPDVVLVSSADETAFEVRELLAGRHPRADRARPRTSSSRAATSIRFAGSVPGSSARRSTSGGVVVELTVLGCSGSYGSPAGGACSGYLVRAGDDDAVDRLRQRLVRQPAAARRIPPTSTAVVITHGHPDHCVDLYGLHVCNKYGLERRVPARVRARRCREATRGAGRRVGRHVRLAPRRRRRHDEPMVGSRSTACGSRAPTIRRRRSRSRSRTTASGSCTRPTPAPDGACEAFGAGADLVLSEATYQHDDIRAPIHLSARQAGEHARAAQRAAADAHPLVADDRPDSLRRRGVGGVRARQSCSQRRIS